MPIRGSIFAIPFKYMADLKQITLSFEPAPADTAASTAATEPELKAEEHATGPKKRGRKPKPAPLVPRQPAKRGRMSLKEPDAATDLMEVPDNEILYQKQYYSIGQVAEMFHVNHSLIRMWSNEFDAFIQTRKNKKGDRYFRPDDIKTLQLIHHLLRHRKFTMEGARDYLKKHKNADERFAMIESLKKIKSFLLEIKASL